ncbi:MAG TPA: hypothetical protein VFY40_04020 [Blastocatellia bacterium]|nr:hypothetical protein [Blastocatellia bacterium]
MSEQIEHTIEGIPEGTFVTSIYVERVYNLGNYENIKVGVRVEIGYGDHPGRVLANTERILGDLRIHSGVDSYDLRRAKAALEKPEAELDESDKKNLDKYREYVRRDEEARKRRRDARQALATLNYTLEHKDHKKEWEDEEGTCHPDDGGSDFDVEF